jgi:Methyl-accepting chemotaxis protein (MCP) signalling domain
MALSFRPKTQSSTRDRLLDRAQALRAMLDSVQANVFVADLDFDLVYANRRAEQTVRTIEHEIQATFGVAWAEMVGGSIHRFHRDPGRVEAILRNPASFPHDAVFTFGAITLRTTINGVFDDAGNCLGYIVAWDDVSQQMSVESTARELSTALAAASAELDAVSQELGASASETSDQAGAVSAGAEQLTASIKEIAESATGAVTVANEAVSVAESGTAAVTSLAASSTEIDAVVKLITSIADQTNLLALNATIEAARAGDSGKGFAVVASEVKDLARATGEATGDIARQVEEIQADSRAAADAINRIHEIIVRINELQTTIASAVEEQAATANDMSVNIGGVAGAAQSTSTGAAAIREAATELSQQATELNDLVARRQA